MYRLAYVDIPTKLFSGQKCEFTQTVRNTAAVTDFTYLNLY